MKTLHFRMNNKQQPQRKRLPTIKGFSKNATRKITIPCRGYEMEWQLENSFKDQLPGRRWKGRGWETPPSRNIDNYCKTPSDRLEFHIEFGFGSISYLSGEKLLIAVKRIDRIFTRKIKIRNEGNWGNKRKLLLKWGKLLKYLPYNWSNSVRTNNILKREHRNIRKLYLNEHFSNYLYRWNALLATYFYSTIEIFNKNHSHICPELIQYFFDVQSTILWIVRPTPILSQEQHQTAEIFEIHGFFPFSDTISLSNNTIKNCGPKICWIEL